MGHDRPDLATSSGPGGTCGVLCRKWTFQQSSANMDPQCLWNRLWTCPTAGPTVPRSTTKLLDSLSPAWPPPPQPEPTLKPSTAGKGVGRGINTDKHMRPPALYPSFIPFAPFPSFLTCLPFLPSLPLYVTAHCPQKKTNIKKSQDHSDPTSFQYNPLFAPFPHLTLQLQCRVHHHHSLLLQDFRHLRHGLRKTELG